MPDRPRRRQAGRRRRHRPLVATQGRRYRRRGRPRVARAKARAKRASRHAAAVSAHASCPLNISGGFNSRAAPRQRPETDTPGCCDGEGVTYDMLMGWEWSYHGPRSAASGAETGCVDVGWRQPGGCGGGYAAAGEDDGVRSMRRASRNLARSTRAYRRVSDGLGCGWGRGRGGARLAAHGPALESTESHGTVGLEILLCISAHGRSRAGKGAWFLYTTCMRLWRRGRWLC